MHRAKAVGGGSSAVFLSLILAVVLTLLSGSGAPAMTAQCYLDRRPGGCYERAIAQQNQKQHSHDLYQKYRASVENAPQGLPDYCTVPSPSIPGGRLPASEGTLSDDQEQSCTSLADDLFQKSSQEQARQANAQIKPSRWKSIEGDNGVVVRIDVNSIRHDIRGQAEATVVEFPSGPSGPFHQTVMLFDCHGQYFNIGEGLPIALPAAPRSVIGAVAAIACTGAKNTFLQALKEQKAPSPDPADYCKGFSDDACERIKTIGKTGREPTYCVPGYGRYGSGLTPEQVRTCEVAAGYAAAKP